MASFQAVYRESQEQPQPISEQSIFQEQPSKSSTPRANSKLVVIAAIILINILFLGGGVFAYSKLSNKGSAPAKKVTAKTSKATAKEEKKAGGNITDCGEIGPDNPENTEKVSKCIDTKFRDCSPAKMTLSLDMSLLGAGIVTYAYEIVGPDSDVCKVKSRYLKNPNPAYLDKEMTCSYDNSKKFEDVSMETMTEKNKCSGPLWDEIQKGGTSNSGTGSVN